MNRNRVILYEGQRERLLAEIDMPYGELLTKAFHNHCSALMFQGDSDLAPKMILAVHMYIDRMSPLMFDTPLAEPTAETTQDLDETQEMPDLEETNL